MEVIFYILQDAVEIGLIWSLMTLGIFISFRVLEFADLTAEGAVTLGSAISVALLLNNVPPLVATIIALIGGFVAGAITGLLHTKLKIPAILAGIISMTGLYSINLRIMGKASIYVGDNSTIYSFFQTLIKEPFMAKTLTTIIVVVLIFLILYCFFGTEIGMSIRATGMNQKMARAQGINTDIMIILGLAIANALIALSGALSAQSDKSANMDIGKGTIVIGLASIILGEVIFGKRTFKNWLISVILGSVIYQALVGIAIALGLNPNDLKLLQAILIAFILAMPLIKKKQAKRSSRKEVVNHA
ncbi:MAG: ABC transporter permease [Bacilli bacterium]|nr:ABC transporter permease [Bacilli bacterium]MDD4388114.1 ABC transporter permease [Bacilli bacterium]